MLSRFSFPTSILFGAGALAELPAELAIEQPRAEEAYFDVSEGLRLGLVEARTDVDYDLDHVALLSLDPRATAAEYERYGFRPAAPDRVEVGGAFVELQPGPVEPTERPLLNHLAVLVDSAADAVADAEELGIEVESTVDAANTFAAFLSGSEGVRIEYVEHKASFSLR